MSSVKCSSRAKGTARASLTPLPGGSSGSANRICVAGASATTLPVRDTAAARVKDPRWRIVSDCPESSMVSHSVSAWPGEGMRSSSVCGMWLRGSEGAQQRRYLPAVTSQQKTVQGELRSAKRDARGQAEILAGLTVPAVDGRTVLRTHDGPECVQIGETAALAATGQYFRGVFAVQVLGETLEHDRGCRADIDRHRRTRQRGHVGRDLAVAVRAESRQIHQLAGRQHGPVAGSIGWHLRGINLVLGAVRSPGDVIGIDPIAGDGRPFGLETDQDQQPLELLEGLRILRRQSARGTGTGDNPCQIVEIEEALHVIELTLHGADGLPFGIVLGGDRVWLGGLWPGRGQGGVLAG